jgi:hypothetical protein
LPATPRGTLPDRGRGLNTGIQSAHISQVRHALLDTYES